MLPMLSELDAGPKLSLEPGVKEGDKLLDEPEGVNRGPEPD